MEASRLIRQIGQIKKQHVKDEPIDDLLEAGIRHQLEAATASARQATANRSAIVGDGARHVHRAMPVTVRLEHGADAGWAGPTMRCMMTHCPQSPPSPLRARRADISAAPGACRQPAPWLHEQVWRAA